METPNKPIIKRSSVDELINSKLDLLENSKVIILALRGFFSKVNQRGIYDDAFVIVSPGVFATFNGNCDPSIYKKGIASIKDGVVWFKKGKHGINKPDGGYWALRESRKIVVMRDDGKGGLIESPPDWPFTNLHRGSINSTSSLGCLTVPPDQWDALRELVYSELVRYDQIEIPCIITSVIKN